MTKDGLNNLDIAYNYLNLPTVVRGGGGDVKVKYSYLADGTKIESVDDAGSGYAYIGSLVYRKSNAGYELESVPFSAGRIEKTTSGYDISYHLTDQVGSVRAVINGVGEVQQQSDYYAFGLRHASTDFATSDNRYQLTGKESQKDFGFNYLDFHARQYDPTGIQFTSQDPLQGKYLSIGAYNYCGGNPIVFVDPDGKRQWPINETYNGYGRSHLNNFGAPRGSRTHQGVDINHTGGGNTDLGAPIIATHDGVVTRVAKIGEGDTNGGGNRIAITAADGSVSTSYMHLNSIVANLKVGTEITEGQEIGTMGGSGLGISNEYASHLHYEIRVDGVVIDPTVGENNLVDPQTFIAPVDGGTMPSVIVSTQQDYQRPLSVFKIKFEPIKYSKK